MRKILFCVLALSILGCGTEDDGNGQSVYTAGLWLESSDGKYIGELVGMKMDSGTVSRLSGCAVIYHGEVGGFFGVELAKSSFCPLTDLYFSSQDCSFASGPVYVQIPTDSMYYSVDPLTGEVYRPATVATSGTVAGKVPDEGPLECYVYADPQPVTEFPIPPPVVLEKIGYTIDLGQPPIVVKVPEHE